MLPICIGKMALKIPRSILASLVPDVSSYIDNRRLHNHEILSGIDVNDDRHHSTILDERSNDADALGRSIEIP